MNIYQKHILYENLVARQPKNMERNAYATDVIFHWDAAGMQISVGRTLGLAYCAIISNMSGEEITRFHTIHAYKLFKYGQKHYAQKQR